MQNDLIQSQEYYYNNLRTQLKERHLRHQQAKRMFNKIQKDLKNIERDNIELQQLITSLLQARLSSAQSLAQF